MTASRGLVTAVINRFTSKESAARKPYLLVSALEGKGDAARWWSIFAFHPDIIEAFGRLQVGDAISVFGVFEAKIYALDGAAPKVSFSLTADALISTRAPPKEARSNSGYRKPRARVSAREAAKSSWAAPSKDNLNEDIPF